MPTGLTKDAGWQIGVSRTVAHPIDDVWAVLVNPAGIAVWLGSGVSFAGRAKERYETDGGVVGELRSYRPGDRIRLTMRSPSAEHDTTIQIALEDKGDRTGIRFHQERLADEAERERQRAHWRQVADEFAELLSTELSPG